MPLLTHTSDAPMPMYADVNVDNFLLLSTSSDSVEKVIDKLTLVLSSVQDDEMREVGYLQAERQRLLQEWQMHALFSYHAQLQRRRARWLYFTLLACQFIITSIAVIDNWVKCEVAAQARGSAVNVTILPVPSQWRWNYETIGGLQFTPLALALCLLPLATAMVQAIFSKFNPLSKYASLEQAALRVRTEIYVRASPPIAWSCCAHAVP